MVSDGKPSAFKRQIKLMPYYLAHYAFRCLTIVTFFIYMKVSLFESSLFCHCQDWAILVAIVPLVSFNMWLTRHTYTLPTNPGRQDHLRFCTVVGGM